MPPLISQANDVLPLPFVGTFWLLQVGGLVNALLFGFNCSQALTHIRQSDNDSSSKVKIKIISIVWLVNVLQIVFSAITLIHYSSNGVLYPEELQSCHWSLAAQTLLTTLGNSIIRSYFVRRLHDCGNNITGIKAMSDRMRIGMTTITTLLCLSSLAFGVALSVEQLIHKLFSDLEKRSYLVYLPLVFVCITDVFMCTCLCFIFRRMHQENSSETQSIREKSTSLLKKVAICRARDGLITTCANIACVITFAIFRDSPAYLVIFSITSKLYFITLLATLNSGSGKMAKERRRTYSSPIPKVQQGLAPRFIKPFRSSSQNPRSYPPNVNIDVHVDQIVKIDGEGSQPDSASVSSIYGLGAPDVAI